MPPTLIYHDFHDKVIRQRASNGYLDATAMCQATGKRWYDYYRLNNTQAFVNALSTIAGIPAMGENKGLIQSRKGGTPENQGTWVHPKVAENLSIWLSVPKSQQREKVIQLKLQTKLGGEIEVETSAGRIDLLTDTQLIEVKAGKDWIHAVGQVIVYGNYYPKHQKRIHLFGDEPATTIDKHCIQLGIELTREQ